MGASFGCIEDRDGAPKEQGCPKDLADIPKNNEGEGNYVKSRPGDGSPKRNGNARVQELKEKEVEDPEVLQKRARRMLEQAHKSRDVEELRNALCFAKETARLQDGPEMDKARNALGAALLEKRAREAIRNAVEKRDEEQLRAAVVLADQAKLPQKETMRAISLLKELEKENGEDLGPHARLKRARAKLASAVESGRVQELRDAIREAEDVVPRDDAGFKAARTAYKARLQVLNNRNQIAIQRRAREAEDIAKDNEPDKG